MLVSLAGAMSTAELGISLAEMIRADKIHAISCTGANLEEDVFNLVAHNHYKRIPKYRDLNPEEEQELLDNHYNRVTDTCIPEMEAMRVIEEHLVRRWVNAANNGTRSFPMNIFMTYCCQEIFHHPIKLTQNTLGYKLPQKRIYPLLFPVGKTLLVGISLPLIVSREEQVHRL